MTQAERLVRKIAEVVSQPASDTQTAKLAQEYADLCRAANRRLEQCAIMIEAGQFLQALQLAETPPPLLDLITVLSFRQAAEWRAYCQAHQLPWNEPFYDKYVRLLNSTYGKGITSDHAFYRDYRRAMLSNDDEQALSILRVIARMNPSDENTGEELKRLEEKVLRVKLEKLRQSMAAGDHAATQAQLAQIETSGLAISSSHPVWQQAQVSRCQELLRRADALRQEDAWQDAEVLVEEIHTLATHYNVRLPEAQAQAWESLEAWTTEQRGAYAENQDFQRALSALEYEVQTFETKRATATRLGMVDARNGFNSLAGKWSEVERFDRPLDEALIARCAECRDWLQNGVKAAGMRQRIASIAVVLLVLGVIGAAIPFFLNWTRERDLLRGLATLESSRRVSDLEALMAQAHVRLKTKPAFAEGLAKAQNFIAHEKELKRVFDEDLTGLQQLAAGGLNSGTAQIGPRREQAEHAFAQLAPEFQIPAKSALNAWDAKWQPTRNAALSAQLDRAEQIAGSLNGGSGFDAIHAALPRIQTILAGMTPLRTQPPELDPNLEARFRKLSAKTVLWTGNAEQWEKAQASLTSAQSLEDYLERLDLLVQSPFATAAQRDAVAEIDRLKINKTALLGELLLPDNHEVWDSLTNVAGWGANLFPEQPTAQEKDAYFKLRDDKNMQNVYVYQLNANPRANNPFRSHLIFVQGSTALDRGGQMAGVVYDPGDSRDAARFALQSYSDWDYASVKKMFQTQECETFERIGLGDLIDPNTGNYQKSILQMFDQLNQEENSSAVFRAFVTLKLFALAELRPEQWGLPWAPGAARHLQALKDLGAANLKSGDWMVRAQSAKYEAPLESYFGRVRAVSLEKQAKFLQQLARATCAADFSFAGFADVNGQPVVRQFNAPAPEYWGWNSRSRSAVLLWRKTGETAFDKVADPLPYTPLFVFNGERRHLLNETAQSVSFPASQAADILPPFFAGRHE
ncbi:MAG TPA: hypothetical protein VFC44_20575 [Candidatus Saccharimonadales bacterium]|nr:hypothetical protein [Candidatus Saccharimonadales bacterium]